MWGCYMNCMVCSLQSVHYAVRYSLCDRITIAVIWVYDKYSLCVDLMPLRLIHVTYRYLSTAAAGDIG